MVEEGTVLSGPACSLISLPSRLQLPMAADQIRLAGLSHRSTSSSSMQRAWCADGNRTIVMVAAERRGN